MKPLLSILIPTVVGRENEINYFMKQHFGNDVSEFIYGEYRIVSSELEVVILKDNKEISIGEKREDLYRMANGIYSWQIDDDDDIAHNAIGLILEAIEVQPDVITFQELCFMNGEQFSSNHSIQYDDWEGDGSRLLADGFHFHRTPFMKSVIKTEIARSVPIPHIRFGEDHQWAQALKPHLKTEHHINQNIYIYQHNSKPEDFNERYGIQ